MDNTQLQKSLLGQAVTYQTTYQPSLLFPIAREGKRMKGGDIWTAYEISWLNPKGKPEIAIGEWLVSAESPYLIESKSLKLYLNSFNQTVFSSMKDVEETIAKDLSLVAQSAVSVSLMEASLPYVIADFEGTCLDQLDVAPKDYEVAPELLRSGGAVVEERLFSRLLKSNCLVTGQPDWGSVWIHYRGPKIDHEALLLYLISFRMHHGFHEQCIERMLRDILERCHPEFLTVYGRYTRRGGLDINPFRSTQDFLPPNIRHARQ